MGALLIQAFKPTLLEYIEKGRKGLAPTLDGLVAQTIAWLPHQVGPLVSVANRLLDWLKARVSAL